MVSGWGLQALARCCPGFVVLVPFLIAEVLAFASQGTGLFACLLACLFVYFKSCPFFSSGVSFFW